MSGKITDNEILVKGKVQIKLVDTRTGKVIKELEKENTATIRGKIWKIGNDDLYLDLITKKLDDIYGQPIEKVVKSLSISDDVNTIRGNLISTLFSKDTTNHIYTCNFQWTNTSAEPVTIYGLISWSRYDTIPTTILDLQDEPLVVDQYIQIIGKYIITYTGKPNTTDSEASSVITINTNITQPNIKITPSVREYKLTRTFVQKTEHLGINQDEVPESSITSSVTNNTETKKTFGDNSQFTGEYIIQITQDGSPGSAKGKKYLRYSVPLTDRKIGDYPGDSYVIYEDDNWIIRRRWDYYWDYIAKRDIDIYPYKFEVPLEVDSAEIDKIKSYIGGLDFSYRNAVITTIGCDSSPTGYTNYIAPIIDNSYEFIIYCDCSIYIDGSWHGDDYNIIEYQPNDSYNGNIAIRLDLYGSFIPLANFSFYGIPSFLMTKIDLSGSEVSGFYIPTTGEFVKRNLAGNEVYYFANVYFKPEDANKKVGTIRKGQTFSFRVDEYAYLIVGNIPFLTLPYFKGNGYHYKGLYIPFELLQQTGYWEFDEANRIVRLNHPRGILIPQSSYEYKNDNIVFTFDSDNNQLKITYSDELTEETINSTETIGNTTITFTDDSVFKQGEYWKVAINDSDNALICDALETWKITIDEQVQYANQFWKNYSKVGEFNRILSKDDNQNYLIPRKIDVKIPRFNILNPRTGEAPNNKVAVYEITFNPDLNTLPQLLLPRFIEDENGDILITKVDNMIVTDGYHLIPHEVPFYADGIETDNDIELIDKYWKIKLDNRIIKQLYSWGDDQIRKNIRLQLYVYFEAKKKEDILPYEIDVKIPRVFDNDVEAVTRIALPFTIDGYIEIKDEEGNSYDFEILKPSVRKFESDNDTGNVVYVKIPLRKKDSYWKSGITFNTAHVQSNGFNIKYHSIKNQVVKTSLYHGRYYEFGIISEVVSDRGYCCPGCNYVIILHSIKLNGSSKNYTTFKNIKLVIKLNTQNNNNINIAQLLSAINVNSFKSKYLKNIKIYEEPIYFVKIYYGSHETVLAQFYKRLNTVTGATIDTDDHINTTDTFDIWNNIYKFDYLVYNTTLSSKSKLTQDVSYDKFQYNVRYLQPLLIQNIQNNGYIIFTLPNIKKLYTIESIKCSSNINIFTKKYRQTDIISHSYWNTKKIIIFDSPYDNNNYNKYIVKSEKISSIISDKFRPTTTFYCIDNTTYNNLAPYSYTNTTINTVDIDTGIYIIPHNSRYVGRYDHVVLDTYYTYSSIRYKQINWHETEYFEKYSFEKIDFTWQPDNPGSITTTYAKLDDRYVDIAYTQNAGKQVFYCMANEEIPVDVINNFGGLVVKYFSSESEVTSDASLHLKIYPVIKIKNTNTGEEIYYSIDTKLRPVDITRHVTEYLTSGNNNPKWLPKEWIEYLTPNIMTYEYFNELLDLYKDGNGTYVASYGYFVYKPDGAPDYIFKFYGMDIVNPEYTDDSYYDEIPWCWFNREAELTSNDKLELMSDGANNKIKIYNPNDYDITYPVRVSLKRAGVDISQFTDGIVVKDSNDNTIPSCYVSQYGKGKPTDNFGYWNRDEIYIRATIPANSTIEYTVENGTPSYTIDEVFDFVENFEDGINTDKWEVWLPPHADSWSDYLDLGGTDTDGDGNEDYHTYGSEVGILVAHELPIEVTDKQTLLIRGTNEGNVVGLYTKNNVINTSNQAFHIRYKIDNNWTTYDVQYGLGQSDFNQLPSANGSASAITKPIGAKDIEVYRNGSKIKSLGRFSFPDEFVEDNYAPNGKIRIDVRPIADENKPEIAVAPPVRKGFVSSDVGIGDIGTTNFGIFTNIKPDNNLEVDWVYIAQKVDKLPIVLYEDDVCVAVPTQDEPSYLLIVPDDNGTPDKDTIDNIIQQWKENPHVYPQEDNDEYSYFHKYPYNAYEYLSNVILTSFGLWRYRQ